MKWVLSILLAVALAAAAGLFYLSRTINPDTIKPRIERAIATAFQADVAIDQIAWRWLPSPYFSAAGISIQRKYGPTFEISEIRIKINLHNILDKKITIDDVEIYRPVINLTRDEKGRLIVPINRDAATTPVPDDAKSPSSFFLFNLNSVKVTEGRLKIYESAASTRPQATQIFVNGTMDFSSSSTVRPFEMWVTVKNLKDKANFFLKGSFGSDVDINFESNRAPVACFSEIIPILDEASGFVSLKGRYRVDDAQANWNVRGNASDFSLNNDGSKAGEGSFVFGSAGPKRFSFKVALERVQFPRGMVDSIVVSGDKVDQRVHVDQLDIEAFGGRANLVGSFDQSTFDMRWVGDGVSALQVEDFLNVRTVVSGVVASSGTLSGKRNPPDFKSFNGFYSVQVASGALLEAPAMLKFISTMNMTSFLKRAKKSGKNELPFDMMAATASVRNGVMFFDQPAVFTSRTLQLAMLGSLDIPGNQIQAKLVVNFLGIGTEIVKMIPGLRSVMMGGEETLLPMFVEITGKRDDPVVNVQSTKSISKQAWGTVLRVLKLPGGIINAVDKTIRGK